MNLSLPVLPGQSDDQPPIKLRRTGVVLSIIAIAICVAFVLFANSRRAQPGVPRTGINATSELQMRYVIGVEQMMKKAKSPVQVEQLLAAEDVRESDHGARFRTEILRAVFGGKKASESPKMEALVKDSLSLKKDLESLRELESKGAAMDADNWSRLLQRHGSAARLARAKATDWKEDDWTKLQSECTTTMGVVVMFSLGGLAAGLGGLGLLIYLAVRWWRGSLVPLMPSPNPRFATAMLEGFAIYLFSFLIGVGILQTVLPKLPAGGSYAISLVFVALAVYWPRLRGMQAGEWRATLGLHRGEGVFKEIGVGMLGWVAGLPILFIGAVIGAMIAGATGLDATHPIVDSLRQPGVERWYLVLLAAVWAPVVEELTFRGLLFPSLSAKSRWIVGTLGSAFIFAVIHPQGWAGIPPLMALASTMTMLRRFRGSIIAPMAAHALNNGLVSLLVIYMF